jgi:hypothetical protein
LSLRSREIGVRFPDRKCRELVALLFRRGENEEDEDDEREIDPEGPQELKSDMTGFPYTTVCTCIMPVEGV